MRAVEVRVWSGRLFSGARIEGKGGNLDQPKSKPTDRFWTPLPILSSEAEHYPTANLAGFSSYTRSALARFYRVPEEDAKRRNGHASFRDRHLKTDI